MFALPKYKIYIPIALLLCSFLLFYVAFHGAVWGKQGRLAALLAGDGQDPAVFWAPQKTGACVARGGLPDSDCTPGAIFVAATKEQICTKGYSASVRDVSVSTKESIYQAYGLSYPQPTGDYEADHLIPLELGGSNDVANLFPEAGSPRPGYHEKDLVENFLHQEMCAGRVALAVAQKQIARDWLAIYNNLSPRQIRQLKAQYKSWSD